MLPAIGVGTEGPAELLDGVLCLTIGLKMVSDGAQMRHECLPDLGDNLGTLYGQYSSSGHKKEHILEQNFCYLESRGKRAEWKRAEWKKNNPSKTCRPPPA